jgi:hypothetical protein
MAGAGVAVGRDGGGHSLLRGDMVRSGAVSAPAFTGGPWQRKDDYDGWLTIIGNVDGESFSDGTTSYTYDFIANCGDEYGEPAKPENVRLILAAPELCAALERLLDQRKAGFFTEYAWEAARAALARAKGDRA